jgi:hypothetical protein
MPNGYDTTREYGGHNYGENPQGTVDCKFGCGCSAGPTKSNGPLGLDPLGGECPNNPKSGQRLSGDGDYRVVVTRRIRGLEKAVYELRERAEKAEKRVGIKKSELADKLEVAEGKIKGFKSAFQNIAEIAERRASD